ncbi:MAG: hypothetical protein H0W15_03025 [Gemmatimonadales bacterium]|nr:hypothetical protein [Gemmatimonadales bacterium]
MRLMPLLLAAVIVAPLGAQDGVPGAYPFLAQPEPTATEEALAFYDSQPYVPIRRGEVYSAGFLTEDRMMAFGRVLGPTRPPQVAAKAPGAEMTRGAILAIKAPDGVRYQPGDTLVLAVRYPGPKGWGDIVVPTGLVRIGATTPTQTLVTLLAMYGPVRKGQHVYPLAPFADRGEVFPAPVVNGARGTVLGYLGRRELAMPGAHIFTDMGAANGVRLGDFVQVRREVHTRLNAPDTINEPMALGQVVHVGARSSTVRLFRVTAPDLAVGSAVVRVATLPE